MTFADQVVAVARSLAAADVPHAFGGALALLYAVREPRLTRDIDLNIAMPVERAAEVMRALPDGVTWSEDDVDEVQRLGQVRLYWDGTPVDLFFPQHEYHATVAARTRAVPFGHATIDVIAPTDLVVFKALFSRPKDWVDIAEVVHAGTADLDEALRWVGSIVGPDSDQHRRLTATIETTLQESESAAAGDPNVWRGAGPA